VTDPQEKQAAVQGRKGRIYEYTNDDGVTFWSFTKLPFVVSPAQRLRIGSRVGTEFSNHLFDLRALRKYFANPDSSTDEK
jgi:hypothetical protein